MTRVSEHLTTENKIVVSFDICSSSDIIEDLILTNNLKAMRDLLIKIKKFLRREAVNGEFEIYKFTGDGWILLFPEDAKGKYIMDLLERLSEYFKELIIEVVSLLGNKPNIIGITFGIDSGKLIRIIMMGKEEYIGRAINIACRLQNSIKDEDKHPGYKVLVSRHTFKKFPEVLVKYKPVLVKRELRNIRNGREYWCVKLSLFPS